MEKREFIKAAGAGVATFLGSIALFTAYGEVTGENKRVEPVVSPAEEVPLNADEAALADDRALIQDARVLEVVAPEMIDTVERTDWSDPVTSGVYMGVVTGLGVALVVGMSSAESQRQATRREAFQKKIDEINQMNPINASLSRTEIEELRDQHVPVQRKVS